MARLHRATTLIFSLASFIFSTAAETELRRGFTATLSRSNDFSFQSILHDPTGNFSLGFLTINGTGLSVAVVHVASLLPLWSAIATRPSSRWSDHTVVSFNGSLVMSDHSTGAFWSTHTDGDRVVLLNTSNLQVLKGYEPPAIIWQSFLFPENTLAENQNFTSNMSLVSSNGLYTMRLGDNFIGLYANLGRGIEQIYWRHRALEARAQIIEGAGPIYAQVNSDGYLAMYQNSSAAVDIESFRSFQRTVNSFVIVRLEPDGNLKGHYWNGSSWVMDYVAISDFCDLPGSCGSYGLCSRDNDSCTCLNNGTVADPHSGRCGHGHGAEAGDLCGKYSAGFRVLRRVGVELPHKELMAYQTVPTLEQCEDICERNCSCWGAVYNNGSGSCYVLDYPIQTLVSVDDESRLGYFKVIKESHHGKAYKIGFGVGFAAWVVLGFVVFGFWYSRRCRSKRGVKSSSYSAEEENKVTPGPYKDLGSASFRSIEMISG